MAEGCGKCWKVTANSNMAGRNNATTLVLKATNYCPPENPTCNNQAHFDIAAPGFDYPAASWHSTCDSNMPGEPALHTPQTCAYWMIHS